jgi:hypothetical protein
VIRAARKLCAKRPSPGPMGTVLAGAVGTMSVQHGAEARLGAVWDRLALGA